jgi:ABC-type molybdate transport system substrate-binding protein
VKKFVAYAIFAGLLVVAGCSASQQATGVAAAGTALTAADTLAMQYVTLPACPVGATSGPGGTLCSQPVVSAQIKVYAQKAYTAYKAYEANPTATLEAAAASALALLIASVPPTTAAGK